LPSGDTAPPVTTSLPGGPSLLPVPVFSGVKVPAFFSATLSPDGFGAAVGT
jgi:hypothetical protein